MDDVVHQYYWEKPQYLHYQQLFLRYMRRFGPSVVLAPCGTFRRQDWKGLNVGREVAMDLLGRVSDRIKSHQTRAAFEKYCQFDQQYDRATFIVNGGFVILKGERELKRLSELLLLHAILGPLSLSNDVASKLRSYLDHVDRY